MGEGRPEIIVFGLTSPNLGNTLLIGQISTNYHITMNMAMFDERLLKAMIIKFSSSKTGEVTLRGWTRSRRSLLRFTGFITLLRLPVLRIVGLIILLVLIRMA
jgi:hypothetical protein